MASPEAFAKQIDEYASRLVEIQEWRSASNSHDDNMLTWAVGLMGAALLATPNFLSVLKIGPRREAFLAAMAPWVLGVLCAIAGRLSLRLLCRANYLHHFARAIRLEQLRLSLRQEKRDVEGIIEECTRIMEDETGPLKTLRKKVDRRRRWSIWAYFASHLLLAIGLLFLTFLVAMS